MGLPRSTYYDAPPVKTDDAAIVTNVTAICDEFEAYGYRRVGAELLHRGMVVNSKKIRRLMREHDLQPKRRRRFVATTDSDHDNPIFGSRGRRYRSELSVQIGFRGVEIHSARGSRSAGRLATSVVNAPGSSVRLIAMRATAGAGHPLLRWRKISLLALLMACPMQR
jgi:transposase InsO family protein